MCECVRACVCKYVFVRAGLHLAFVSAQLLRRNHLKALCGIIMDPGRASGTLRRQKRSPRIDLPLFPHPP